MLTNADEQIKKIKIGGNVGCSDHTLVDCDLKEYGLG